MAVKGERGSTKKRGSGLRQRKSIILFAAEGTNKTETLYFKSFKPENAQVKFTHGNETDPEKIEHDLEKVLPKDHWILFNIQIITFGRQICFARSPKCEECFLQEFCREKHE